MKWGKDGALPFFFFSLFMRLEFYWEAEIEKEIKDNLAHFVRFSRGCR